jgi:hypothetical protein
MTRLLKRRQPRRRKPVTEWEDRSSSERDCSTDEDSTWAGRGQTVHLLERERIDGGSPLAEDWQVDENLQLFEHYMTNR